MPTTNFPSNLDDNTSLPNPGIGNFTDNPSHAGQHDIVNDGLKAVETKIGIGASTPVANCVFRGTGSGTSAWGQLVLTTDVTGVLPTANGGTGTSSSTGSGAVVFATSPALTTPTIADFTNATHSHANAAGGGTLNGANAIQPETLTPAQIVNRVRWAMFSKTADGSGGSVISQQESNEIQFSGTPTAYGRLDLIVPQDYVAGTNATINLIIFSGSANNQAMNYFVGSHATGSTFSSWNVQSSVTTGSTLNLTANVISTFALYTILAANLSAGAVITVALKPASAITGTVLLTQAYLAYTADM